MADVYRKYGRTVRYEHGLLLRVDEAGEAIEDADTFACRPIARHADLPPIDDARVTDVAREIESMITPPLTIERLVVTEGVVEHQMEDRRWREQTARVHLSIVFRSMRVILDFGSDDREDLKVIASALHRAGAQRPAPARLTLAPNVAAALLPSLIGVAPPNIRLWQSAGGFDGKGLPVERTELSSPPWPNWYRPSYRTRPVRAPFNLRATCDVTEIEAGLPRAIALLAPPVALQLNVLCVDGEAVFPAQVRVNRIDAIGESVRWFPYGAGSFGAEMML